MLFCEPCSNNRISRKVRLQFKFDLQLFDDEKTEDPTSKRLSDARSKGQVSKSQEITSVFVIFSGFMGLKIFGSSIYAQITNYMTFIFSNLYQETSVENVMRIIFDIGILLAKTALPVMLTILLVGLAVNYYQVGFLFTTQPLSPSLSKLNPINGFKRMFSLRSLVELAKSVLKIVIIGTFIYRFLSNQTPQLPKLIYSDVHVAIHLVADLILSLIYQIGGVMLVLGLFDYAYQKWQYKKGLKMSKHDVKEEYKQAEGDPQIKGKIKQKQREMALRRMMQEVPKADVIVTNPTHYAVALKYDKGMTAPVVIAKGQDIIAQRIKEIAKEAKIVIVENKPLARALYSTTEVGDVVPQELYKSVAEVLAYVYRLKKRLS